MRRIECEEEDKDEILVAIKGDFKSFATKLLRLRSLWAAHDHDICQVRRLSPIIFDDITPFNASIVADNLDYFKLHYIKSDKNDRNMIK